MQGIPPIAWVIAVLGIVWIVVRIWASRAEEQRRIAREERIARLMAEREQAPQSQLPHSLSAVTSDREPAEEKSTGKSEQKSEVVKVRCRACKTLNDESAKTCTKCGAEM